VEGKQKKRVSELYRGEKESGGGRAKQEELNCLGDGDSGKKRRRSRSSKQSALRAKKKGISPRRRLNESRARDGRQIGRKTTRNRKRRTKKKHKRVKANKSKKSESRSTMEKDTTTQQLAWGKKRYQDLGANDTAQDPYKHRNTSLSRPLPFIHREGNTSLSSLLFWKSKGLTHCEKRHRRKHRKGG